MTENNKKPRIAFIGIGLMGSRMVSRLLKAGYSVCIRNRSYEKCLPLEKQGLVWLILLPMR